MTLGGRGPTALVSRRWGHLAAAWSVTFAVLHLYWGLGGSVGLAESAGTDLAEQRPTWFVVLGLYGVALTLGVAAVLGLALARVHRVRRSGRLLTVLGAGLAAVLLARAVAIELLLLTDAGYGGGAISEAQRSWSLVVWNPWFLIGGTSFGLAARAARRRWTSRSAR